MDENYSSSTSKLAAIAQSILASCADPSQKENELVAIDDAIRALKQLRNEKNAFVVLPIEILSHIFVFVRDACHDFSRPMKWIRATTHVCRHLRLVALSYRLLWTAVSGRVKDKAFLSAVIERSEPLPLSLTLTLTRISRNHSDGCKELARECYLQRVRDLELHLEHADDRHSIHHLFWSPMPLLARLTIVDGLFILVGHPLLPIDPPPTLTTLILKYNAFPWTSNIYDNLHELTLFELEVPKLTLPSLQDLFNRMRRLERLTLDGLTKFPRKFRNTDVIRLPANLHSFSLRSRQPEKFISHVAPSASLRHLSVRSVHNTGDIYDSLEASKIFGHCDSSCVPGTSKEVHLTLAATSCCDSRSKLDIRVQRRFTPSLRAQGPTTTTTTTTTTTEVEYQLEYENRRWSVGTLLAGDLPAVTELSVALMDEKYPFEFEEPLAELLRDLPRAHTLRISRVTFVFYYQVLRQNPRFLPRLCAIAPTWRDRRCGVGLADRDVLRMDEWLAERERIGYGKVTVLENCSCR